MEEKPKLTASLWADERFAPFCKELNVLLEKFSFILEQAPNGDVFVRDLKSGYMAPLTPYREKEDGNNDNKQQGPGTKQG